MSQGAPILTLELDGAGAARGTGETVRHRAAGADQRAGGSRRGPGTGHRRLQGRARHRGHGQGRATRSSGTAAGHPRIRQGLDGNTFSARRRGADIKVKLGDRVSEGTVILTLGTDPAAAAGAAAPAAAAAPAQPAAPAPAADSPHRSRRALIFLMPGRRSRKLARELGVDSGQVKGSGPRAASCRTTSQFRQDAGRAPAAIAAPPASSRRTLEPAAVAEGRFRQVRADRDQATLHASRRFPAPTCTATG